MARRRGAARKGINRNRERWGKSGPKKPHRANFKPSQNSQTGEVHRRGVDLIPRRQLQRGILIKALTEQELRDVKSGKRVTGRAARRRVALIRGAMLEDLATAFRRAAYGAAHEHGVALQEAATAVRIALNIGDHIAIHLDDKPAALPRVTTFIGSGAVANQEIPTDRGQRSLTQAPAEDPYVDVREEDVP